MTLTGDTLEYPIPSDPTLGGPYSTAGWTMGLTGTCTVPGGNMSGSGSVSGWCGDATGSGTIDGHSFTFAWTGAVWTFSGDVRGWAAVHPDLTTGHSCTTGAGRFLVQAVLEFAHTPPSDPVSTVTSVVGTLPGVPPGGPAGPSTQCTSGGVVNNDNPIALKLSVQTLGPTTSVCVRVGNYGGKLSVTASGGVPPIPAVPTTDSSADSCHTTSGNGVPGTHPILSGHTGDPGGPTYVPYLFDVYNGGGQVWVCVRAGSSHRVVIPVPGLPGIGLPSVTFDADQGTPDPI